MRKPILPISVFKSRRQRLARLIPNCTMVVPTWPEYLRSLNSPYVFRPDANLFYLTGFDEPESVLVFRPGKTPETILFVRDKDETKETWDGFRYGPEGAKAAFGVDATFSIKDFKSQAPALLNGSERIYYSLFRNPAFDALMGEVMMDLGGRIRTHQPLPPIEDAYGVLGEMRLRKSEEEIEIHRKACAISAEAHIELMKATKPGISERALQGIFLKAIMEKGATGEAYSSIVASGNNSTTLHYVFNESTLQAGDLLLVDAGAEHIYFCGDITRTYPVTGKFSVAQKRIYEKILKVQKALIDMVKPGLLFSDLQTKTVEALTQILIEEKLLQGSVAENVKSYAYQKYYPHSVSHLLGMDPHDVGSLRSQGESRPIEPGWCLTIEPGLYFPAQDPNVPAELKGIGIRIEDDLLVTADGCEVMTRGVPKETEEIEALVGANYR